MFKINLKIALIALAVAVPIAYASRTLEREYAVILNAGTGIILGVFLYGLREIWKRRLSEPTLTEAPPGDFPAAITESVIRIEKALEKLDPPPDMFIFCGYDKEVIPEAISGIPVYKASWVTYSAWGDSGLEFIPVWKDYTKDRGVQSTTFQKAYENA